MDRNDRQAIEDLFGKLADVERNAAPRDEEAERFIAERIAHQPAAPYYMAQTIIVQEQALEMANRRIEELEHELATRAQRGGFLSSLFGSAAPPPRPQPQPQASAAPAPAAASPWGRTAATTPAQPGGSGFLAGAAQTAVGVAGGVLLGNAIAGLFGADAAKAAEPPNQAEPQADENDEEDDDTDLDDGGDDFFDI